MTIFLLPVPIPSKRDSTLSRGNLDLFGLDRDIGRGILDGLARLNKDISRGILDGLALDQDLCRENLGVLALDEGSVVLCGQ